MPQYSANFVGPDEEKLIRLAAEYGYPKPGSFLKRAVQEFPEKNKTTITAQTSNNIKASLDSNIHSDNLYNKKTLDKLDELLDETENEIEITSENKILMAKVYSLYNYYIKNNGTGDDINVCLALMNTLLSGLTPSKKGIASIERNFKRHILRSRNKKRYFVRNKEMEEADKYIPEYLVDDDDDEV